jgi:hypothetical protein
MSEGYLSDLAVYNVSSLTKVQPDYASLDIGNTCPISGRNLFSISTNNSLAGSDPSTFFAVYHHLTNGTPVANEPYAFTYLEYSYALGTNYLRGEC